jgi:hypothetical protein
LVYMRIWIQGFDAQKLWKKFDSNFLDQNCWDLFGSESDLLSADPDRDLYLMQASLINDKFSGYKIGQQQDFFSILIFKLVIVNLYRIFSAKN